MADKTNIEARIKKAEELRASLQTKLEKVANTPREEEFRLQLEKLDGLIVHLREELNE